MLPSGAHTYTVICVAPREIGDLRERAMAYLRRDREFLLAALCAGALAGVALGSVMAIWVTVVLVVTIEAFAIFVWATK